MLEWIKNSFSDLSKERLYEILKFRMEIFILEQRSFYLDLDEIDQKAVHFMGFNQGKLIAYARVNQDASVLYIRRVAIHADFRKQGIGAQLMQQVLNFSNTVENISLIELDAQYHLESFYARYGFSLLGEPYDDGGILHVKMIKDNRLLLP
ncbi:MAG: elaA [Gammaproteobacteria bacterium]|jgi:ElaA protein|nr:elaA [Gammaproteobacteria bacterium]